MPGLRERLRGEPMLVADGAWGTELIRSGLAPDREPADAWNLRHPHAVAEIATRYGELVDMLTTNTFGANRIRLAQFNLAEDLTAINVRGVEISRDALRAVGHSGCAPQWVAGAIGPIRGPGASHPDDGELAEVYREQAASLVEAGCDLLLIETMTDLREARIAVEAARSVCTLEIVCSFAFREGAPGHFDTWSGDSVAEALNAALEAGAVVVGANCVSASPGLLPLVKCMRGALGEAPLWLKPNAGQHRRHRDRAGRLTLHYPYPFTEARLNPLLDELGHGVIGGCCGTSPEDIALLRRLVDGRASRPSGDRHP